MRPSPARLWLLLGLAVLLSGWLPASVHAADGSSGPRLRSRQDPIPEDRYWELVAGSRQTLADLRGRPSGEIRAGLVSLAAQWKKITAVTLRDGRTEPIDTGYLVAALTAPEPDLDHLQSSLSDLEAAHRIYPTGVFTPADLQSLQDILARPEFRGLDQSENPIAAWLQRMWSRLLKWIADLLQKLFGNRSIDLGGGESSPLEILSIAILILVLAYAFRSIFADFISDSELRENGNSAEAVLTSQNAFERAQMLSRGGEYRSAVRYLYLSCLLLLDERGLLQYDHSKTNREVLRSVSNTPELAQPLQDVVEVFDNVWYGYHTLDEAAFRHYSRRVDELMGRKK